MTQFEMITFTELSGSGMFSISPLKNSTFSAPALRWFSRARASGPLHLIFLYGFGPSKFVRKSIRDWPHGVPEFTRGRKQGPALSLPSSDDPKSARQQTVKRGDR